MRVQILEFSQPDAYARHDRGLVGSIGDVNEEAASTHLDPENWSAFFFNLVYPTELIRGDFRSPILILRCKYRRIEDEDSFRSSESDSNS
jgi:hypothetical protein